ncbi:hypothetical protein HID58_079956, partial [Brassica napus]
QAADTEIGENSHVAESVDGTADVSGRHKRKHAERGAESRNKKVVCQLAASSKGNIDTDMKTYFTTFAEKFCQQFSDRLGKIETEFGKIETETTQLRTASDRTEQFETVVTDMLGKIVAESIIDTGPNTSKKDTAPSKKNVTIKRKCCKKKKLKTDDSYINLPLVNLTQSSAIDLRIHKSFWKFA